MTRIYDLLMRFLIVYYIIILSIMPEGPVLKAWVHRFHRHLAGTKDKLQGRTIFESQSHLLILLLARFVFYPRCFAMGTAVKDYVTCSTQQVEGYNPAMDRVEEDRPEHMQPSKMDRERSKKKPWEYLLENRLSGEFLVGVRGKVLAVAAGHVRSRSSCFTFTIYNLLF